MEDFFNVPMLSIIALLESQLHFEILWVHSKLPDLTYILTRAQRRLKYIAHDAKMHPFTFGKSCHAGKNTDEGNPVWHHSFPLHTQL